MTTYKDSGVDVEAGYKLVKEIKDDVLATHDEYVLPNFGGFAAMYELPPTYTNPVLVTCTDGVGTKVSMAEEYGFLDTIGQDLVAMCVNDLICCGATPLTFLDYYATSSLDVTYAATVIKGIAAACKKATCSLVGGETAEMPGVYLGTDFDLAGFATGIVSKSEIIDGSALREKDVLIALESSGFHSNGYSLLRKLMTETDHRQEMLSDSILNAMIEPTRLYTHAVFGVLDCGYEIHAMANITGGGVVENLPRMFTNTELVPIVQTSKITDKMPYAFAAVQQMAGLSDMEMLNTFNCGVGMIWAVNSYQVDAIMDKLYHGGYPSWIIGEVNYK